LIRRELTNAQWRRIEQLLPGKEGDKGRHGEDNRLFVDAVLWIARAGAPWRDLPEEFGTGTVCSSGSADGPRRAFGSVFSMR
jgi:transposase